jgi:ubiquinone/menaquinone biosynthesis C-methylase UbiE
MSSLNGVWKAIGQQLGHPFGIWGSVIGYVMAIANRRPNQLAIDALEITPSDVVLELGFGPGSAIQAVASRASAGCVLGIDRSASMLAQASRRNWCAIKSGRVKLQQGRFDALPWAAESMDKILAVNVVYFFRAGAAEVREARRVLRPGGVMAIYATDRSVMKRWKFSSAATHETYNRDDLISLLRRGGFDDGEITVAHANAGFGVAGLLGIVRKRAAYSYGTSTIN